MDRMLVIVFDNESNAYEGKEALLALDDDGGKRSSATLSTLPPLAIERTLKRE